jgi:hypothetical protein
MNTYVALSFIIILIVVFYFGRESNVDVPLIDNNNVYYVLGFAIAVFVLSSIYENYRRDVNLLCANIPRKALPSDDSISK